MGNEATWKKHLPKILALSVLASAIISILYQNLTIVYNLVIVGLISWKMGYFKKG